MVQFRNCISSLTIEQRNRIMSEITPQVLLRNFNKAYYSNKVIKEDFDNFYSQAATFAQSILEKTDSAKDKREESYKWDFAHLLKNTLYKKLKNFKIETKNDIDMAIIVDNNVNVIMEFKRPSNKVEMIQKNNLNKKALHEAIYYYFQEKYICNNINICSILISNGIDFYIFDTNEFKHKSLEKIGKEVSRKDLLNRKTEDFYSALEQTIKDEKIDFDYTYFNVKDFTDASEHQKTLLYKILHPNFLTKNYTHRDSNQLNNKFYSELLHILGLSEVQLKGKLYITASNSNEGLINETIEQLEISKDIYNKDEAFDIAFELVITWLNRCLFLKLFEAQLLSFNNNEDEYRFLTSDKIKSYDDLNNLFFKILGRKLTDRTDLRFNHIPYLNSSLFELSSAEKDYFSISSLDNSSSTSIFKNSSIRAWPQYKDKKRINTLKYLLDFLDSYNFSSVSDGEFFTKNSYEIINSAVLGLIFEKLNGYKEGAYFTPGYITEFMARLSIEKIVIQKFNQSLRASATSIDEIKNLIGSPVYKTEDLQNYNAIVDSIKIIDPAVGSGHFLVSCLNYLIYLKSKLGILWDGKTRISQEVDIVDDSLVIFDGDHSFSYKRVDQSSLRLQKALFNEKRQIIENCLFGVDINEKSVSICRLRLWIELLKNAYYINSQSNEMELLPNIDINIKSNNSLVSKFHPIPGKSITKAGTSKKLSDLITNYKKSVFVYKQNGDKKEKQIIKNQIQQIKTQLYSWVQQDLFENSLENNHDYIYKQAMEWMIEFPEVLDEKGIFRGFDLVIGNPPYIKEPENKALFEPLKFDPMYMGKMDIWYLFCSRGLDILKPNGYLCFIAPNNWITNFGAKKLRNDILTRSTFSNYIDFNNFMIFDSASIQTMIFLLEKKSTRTHNFIFSINKTKTISQQDISNFLISYPEVFENSSFDTNKISMTASDYLNKPISFMADNQISSIINKISAQKNIILSSNDLTNGIHPHHAFVTKKHLEILGSSYRLGEGVFVLTKQEIDQLNLPESEKSLLQPFYESDKIHRFYTENNSQYRIIYTDSSFKEETSMDKFPILKRHLDRFADIITSDNRPYGLHRARKKHFFIGEKVVSLRKCLKPTFSYSNFDCYVGAKYYIIQTNKVNLKFLTGLLNSNLIEFWLKHKGKLQGNIYQIDKAPLLTLPIKTDDKISPIIAEKVQCIINAKKDNLDSDISSLEYEINNLVYSLYSVSDEEKQIIEDDINT